MHGPAMRSSRTRVLYWGVLAGVGVLATVAATSLFVLRPSYLKRTAENTLSERLGLDVTIGSLAVAFVPRVRISGRDMTFRVPAHPDWPPFVAIDHFWLEAGPFSAARGHVEAVHVEGLRVTVPPGSRPDLSKPSTPAPPARAQENGRAQVIIDHLETSNAVLTVLRQDPAKPPLEFQLHSLRVDDVGFDSVMPFSTVLTNPVPRGEVVSSGTVGPWKRGDPAGLPLSGAYTFTLANLDTIKGIGGTLTSEGVYEGQLNEIRVVGRTETPDFNLDVGGHPVPLTTEFKAVVDGLNGTTTLEHVNAKLFNTSLNVTGVIENLPGPGRRDIKLDVAVSKGRIEDVLTLAVDSPNPLLTGAVVITGQVALPPGTTPVRDRLRLKGRFGLEHARFTTQGIESKLRELSRRSRGRSREEEEGADSRVMTHMAGRYELSSGVFTLPDLTFGVPGAIVALDGRYGLGTGQMDFAGSLRMEASLSKAVGGFKSVFIKPFDWLFRRDGAGAVVPIRITGTPNEPRFGVRVGKVFSRSDD